MAPINIPAAEAIRLKDFVDYASGSVVSKTLVNKPTLTLTLFAFDEGQALSEHTAPFDALVEVLDGRCELVIGGKTVEAGEGEIVRMPASTPHSVNATARFKMLLTMIRDQP
jgi:quercetin dioxygenase-like cupin family protein